MVIIVSKDGKEFKANESLIKLSVIISESLTNGDDLTNINDTEDEKIPLNYNYDLIQRVVTYCDHHYNAKGNEKMDEIQKPIPIEGLEKEIPKWYYDYISPLDKDILFAITDISNFLNIESLNDLACAQLASLIQDKTVPEIREILNLPSPE
jgi:hypothetical protein